MGHLLQLLSLYLGNLARILKHQGSGLQLEYDFAICVMTLCLEGWSGLQGFGGNLYFCKSAKHTMQLKDGNVSSVTHDQIDLANVRSLFAMLSTVSIFLE